MATLNVTDEVPEAVPPLDEEMREELDRRLAAYYADPSSAQPWLDIRDELFRED